MSNMIAKYKEIGLSQEGARAINIIRGCILGSCLENEEKRDLCNLMTDLEEYLEDEETNEHNKIYAKWQ